jgi:type I restriction enzyme, R subunit
MITDINREDRLVKQTFAEHLEEALGWDSVYAWNAETFGDWGLLTGTQTSEPPTSIIAFSRLPCFWH